MIKRMMEEQSSYAKRLGMIQAVLARFQELMRTLRDKHRREMKDLREKYANKRILELRDKIKSD